MSEKTREKEILGLAKEIATKAHEGATRRNGDDYVTHPIRVSENVTGLVLKIAALFHDVLEDTDYSSGDLVVPLLEKFPEFEDEIEEAIEIVRAVTHDKEDETYVEYLHRIKLAGPKAIAVKEADIIDNLNSDSTEKEKIKYPTALLFLKDEIKLERK